MSIKIKAISFYKILSDFRFAGRLVKRYTFSDSVQQKYSATSPSIIYHRCYSLAFLHWQHSSE